MKKCKQLNNTISEILRLKRFPQSVLTEPISDDKWSIREIIGHLFYWDKFNLENMVPNMSNSAMLPPFPDHDLFNKEAVSYLDKYDSVEALIDVFVITRKELIKKISSINNDIQFKIENEPSEFSIESFIDIFVVHDFHHLKQIREKLKYKEFKIEQMPLYTPQIGHLVSMMDYARFTTLNAIRGLTIEQLDFLPNENSNSIGALLLHMAAVEIGFQIEIFDERKPNQQEIDEWGAAYGLGELGRRKIKDFPLEFYIKKLETVRRRTLEEFRKRNDDWLYEERLWDNNLSNNYFIWFHVFEDEINHRGQIRIIRKMLPKI